MIIDQRVVVEAPVESVWAFTGDVAAVAQCLPGVQQFEPEGDDTYTGALKVKVGPVELRLAGRLRITERDPGDLHAKLEAEAADRRIQGAVKATSTLQLEPLDGGTTALSIHTDAAVLGKLGEFGQAVMRRKANQLLQQFARNMARGIAERSEAQPADGSPDEERAEAEPVAAERAEAEPPASGARQAGNGQPETSNGQREQATAPAVHVARAPAGTIDLNGVRLRNRLVTSASLLGYGASKQRFILYGLSPVAQWVPLERFGAVTTRTLTLEPREGHFTLRDEWPLREFPSMLRQYDRALRRVDAGWINAFGWSNIGVERYFDEYFPKTEGLNRIVSVGGFSAEEFCALVETVNKHAEPGEIAAVEFNVSCHNVNFPFEEILADVLDKAVPLSAHPVIVKLSPDGDYVAAARVAERAGAAALTAINGVKALRLDPDTGEPLLKNRYGSITGRAIKPIGLRVVAELRDAGVGLPVIATGGIRTFDDCKEYFWAGADAVSLGSSTWLAPLPGYALGPVRGLRIRRLLRQVAGYELPARTQPTPQPTPQPATERAPSAPPRATAAEAATPEV